MEDNTALNKKAVWRESEIERLNSQLDSLQRRYDYLAEGIEQKVADFKAEKDRLELEIAAKKSTLAEMQAQQETSARRIQELTREKGTVESQSREALLSLTSQKDAAESRASEAHRSIQSLRSEKEIAEAAVAELRPALTLAQKEVTTLTEQNQLALQQLAEKTQTAAAAQRTIELQEAELRAFREQSTATSQRVDEQASRILQQETALAEKGSMVEQLASRNQELTTQNALLQSQVEDSPFRQLDSSRSASIDPSALELEELKERFSQIDVERVASIEERDQKIFALSQLIARAPNNYRRANSKKRRRRR